MHIVQCSREEEAYSLCQAVVGGKGGKGGGGTFYVTARAPPPPPGETGRPARF